MSKMLTHEQLKKKALKKKDVLAEYERLTKPTKSKKRNPLLVLHMSIDTAQKNTIDFKRVYYAIQEIQKELTKAGVRKVSVE